MKFYFPMNDRIHVSIIIKSELDVKLYKRSYHLTLKTHDFNEGSHF